MKSLGLITKCIFFSFRIPNKRVILYNANGKNFTARYQNIYKITVVIVLRNVIIISVQSKFHNNLSKTIKFHVNIKGNNVRHVMILFRSVISRITLDIACTDSRIL